MLSGAAVQGQTKLTDVIFGTIHNPVESVTLLLRDSLSLKDYRIEYRSITEINTTTDSGSPNFGVPALLESSEGWSLYHQFADDTLLPVGTRVRTYTSFSGYQPPEETGLVQIEAKSRSFRFPGMGVELRLVDTLGVSVHQRSFYPNSSYESVSGVKALRSADGTGLFLKVADLSSEYQYRLKFVFNRKYPNGIELSQSGNSDPEIVVLDIPNPNNSRI